MFKRLADFGLVLVPSVAIHPDLSLDVFVDEPSVSVGVYSDIAKKVIVNRGAFKSDWSNHAGVQTEARFSDGEYQ